MQVSPAPSALAAPSPSPTPGRAFAREGVYPAGWYPVEASRRVRPGEVRAAALFGRRLALWRDPSGGLQALDGRCPHLGADLAGGRVQGGALVCPFHGWAFRPGGGCEASPGQPEGSGRPARALPVHERWGLVWVANSAQAPALPEALPGAWSVLRPPPQRFRCHAHLVLGNGLDPLHFDALHGMTLQSVEGERVSLEMTGHPRSPAMQRFTGATASRPIRVRFTTHGASVATADVEAPVRFRALFTATPDGAGCTTRVVLFLPRSPGPWLRALAGLYALLHDDRRVLEGLRFRPAFTPADAPLAAFAQVVDALPRGWGGPALARSPRV